MKLDALIDRPGMMREEDALDVAAVDRFLKERVSGLEGRPEVSQYAGGASNLTYLLRYPRRELVLRRPPFGPKARSAHDVLREARIMTALKPAYGYVPEVLALGDDQTVLGCDFYVMERLRGIILRRDIPQELGLTSEGTRELCLKVLDRLIELHSLDPETAALGTLGKGSGYVRRQVDGWIERWRQASIDGVASFPEVPAWLDRVAPKQETAIRVIHNDFRLDNVVLDRADPQHVIGVLDWEMATLGDPLMDLGGALAYWVQADDGEILQANRRQPSNAPGMLTRAEIVAYYGQKTGFGVEVFDFYEVFGLFRLSVIVQQIYKRFVLKQTTNSSFASFGTFAEELCRRCQSKIACSTL